MRVLRLLSVVAVVLLAACGGDRGPRLLEPQVTVSRIDIRGLGLQGGSLDLILDVDNPNDRDLRIVGVDGGLEVPTGTVGVVRGREIVDLPANGRAQMTLPLRFQWRGLGEAFRSALGYGDLQYRFRGQVDIDVDRRIVTYPFTREGRAPLKQSINLP